MGQPIPRGYVCCSIRDKYGHGDSLVPSTDVQSFESLESEVHLEAPIFSAFSPLNHKEAAVPRRIALASRTEVHVYRLSDALQPLKFELTHTLQLTGKRVVTGIIFPDEGSARQLAIAFGPESTATKGHTVRVWSCLSSPQGYLGAPPEPSEQQKVVSWHPDEGFAESLEEHTAHIRCMAVGRSYFITADDAGECRVWQKGRAFTRAAAATIHAGGVADLSADRLYAYSAGSDDRKFCVWALPTLSQVITISVTVDLGMCIPFHRPDAEHATVEQVNTLAPKEADPTASRYIRLTHLRRPLSRWAGWQGSNRGPKVPRGLVFLAGVVEVSSTGEGTLAKSNPPVTSPGSGLEPGSGVLLEYSLGADPQCRSMQKAHDAPIVSMVYGPYDNGPLLTADERGVFRVWDLVLEKGPRFSQQIELLRLGSPGQFAVCVEQPLGLFVAAGGGRIFLWRKQQEIEQTT